MLSAARILADTTRAEHAVRWALVGKLGRIRSRKRGKGAAREFFLDFRPYGRVWSHRGIRLTDEETARRLMEQIRGQVAEDRPLANLRRRQLRELPEAIPEADRGVFLAVERYARLADEALNAVLREPGSRKRKRPKRKKSPG